MADKAKIALKRGKGTPPGYMWTVLVLDTAHREARKFLNKHQYAHVAGLVRELARENDPSHSRTCSVDAIEDFWELREKYGPLGKINVRLFFFLDRARRTLVVLGAIKKENNGATPVGDKIRMRRRKRMYLNGNFGISPAE